jgi:hypothetical protein
MFDFLLSQFAFYLTLILVLFLPGYGILRATYGKNKPYAPIEIFLISFGLSLVTIDIILIFMDKLGIPLTRTSILTALTLFFLACGVIFFFKKTRKIESIENESSRISFSRKEFYVFILLIFLSIFFRTIYLKNTISPTATDLGHHMYWVNVISQTHVLPDYTKIDIIQNADNYSIGAPQKIDDFIIGEHIFLAAITLITGENVISSFPVITLYLVDIMGILAIFALTYTLFSKFSFAKIAALFSIFLLGPIFAFSSSQANFVSGGVIGNLLGNVLIPLSLYFFYRALEEKRLSFFVFGIFTTFGLFYTHHLSAFIFIFAIAATFALLFFSPKKALVDAKELLRQAISPASLIIISLVIIFFFFVLMPSYIRNNAVKTIIGAPSRSTKEGLSLTQLSLLTGEIRTTLAILGLFVLFFFRSKFYRQFALITGWMGVIFLMSWQPTLVNINIPSTRIANYLVFPAVVASSFFLAWFFQKLKSSSQEKFLIKETWVIASFLLIFIFTVTEGYYDNASSLKDTSTANSAIITYNSAKYLASRIDSSDLILKDHNFISNDSWMKIFFMRDYNFPLTRGFFFRYDTATKEQCTLTMISNPNSQLGKKCFQQTGTNFVMINPTVDGVQFEKNAAFWEVYDSGAVSTFYLKK